MAFPPPHIPEVEVIMEGTVVSGRGSYGLVGKPKVLSQEEAVKLAVSYVANQATGGDAEALTVIDYYQDDFAVHHIFICQVLDGIKVENLVASVHIDPYGTILMSNHAPKPEGVTTVTAPENLTYGSNRRLTRRSSLIPHAPKLLRRSDNPTGATNIQVTVGPIDAAIVVATALGYDVSDSLRNLRVVTVKLAAPAPGFPEPEVIKVIGFSFSKRDVEAEFVGYLSPKNEVIPVWRILMQSKRSLYNVMDNHDYHYSSNYHYNKDYNYYNDSSHHYNNDSSHYYNNDSPNNYNYYDHYFKTDNNNHENHIKHSAPNNNYNHHDHNNKNNHPPCDYKYNHNSPSSCYHYSRPSHYLRRPRRS
ncbi:hypothetical protein HDU67_008842 [Dinochytrium kinnereticum]|nr:hypothetical protein HDU67_008842 [Dinochytrium kinnereticum]